MIERKDGKRRIVLDTEIHAAPADIWQALSSPEEIEQWFPLRARGSVEEGGKVEITWDEENWWGMHVEIPDPGRHLRLVTKGEDYGAPGVLQYVDIEVEGRSGSSIVRLVHSGYDEDAQWDEMLDGQDAGWAYFLRNLAVYVENHLGERRTVLHRRPEASGDRREIWERAVSAWVGDGGGDAGSLEPGASVSLETPDGPLSGTVEVAVPGRTFAVVLPEHDHAIVFSEVESAGEAGAVGMWVSTWGASEGIEARLEGALEGAVGRM